jgi:hypothetical protein
MDRDKDISTLEIDIEMPELPAAKPLTAGKPTAGKPLPS